MQNESSIGVTSATPDAGAFTAVDSPSTQGTESNSSANVTTTPPIQEGATQEATTETDPLAGIPSIEEAQAMDTVSKEAFLSLRGAYDEVKPKFTELETKFAPFLDVADRFTNADEVKQAVEWHDKLFGAYERDDRNKLVPATERVAQDLAAKDPLVADYLSADLMNGLTRTDDGREVSRFDLALEEIGTNPDRKADRLAALKLLGGVEPTSIAPTWQATAEELEVVRPELQDIYKQLPYDERESLKLNDPDFINKYLAKEKFQADLMRENETAKELQTRQQQQREQYFRQQAESAGHKAVEDGFRQLFTEYRTTVVENSKFLAPIDPQSPEAQQMGPEAVAQINQKVQSVNSGVGAFVALTTAALSVPDTAWMAESVLKELGVPDEVLQKFNAARQEYANNTRDAGELGFEAQQGRNGHSGGLGTLQSNARKAASNLKANGNLISKSVKALLSDFFEMKAGNYNATLNGAATARPPVNGTGFNPTTAPAQRPVGGTLSRKEIDAMYG